VTPLARIVSTAVTGLSPEIMGLGPVEAIPAALKHAGMSIDDIDLYEINEAFAVQAWGSAKVLGIPLDKLNVNGGAIAIGPVAATSFLPGGELDRQAVRRAGLRVPENLQPPKGTPTMNNFPTLSVQSGSQWVKCPGCHSGDCVNIGAEHTGSITPRGHLEGVWSCTGSRAVTASTSSGWKSCNGIAVLMSRSPMSHTPVIAPRRSRRAWRPLVISCRHRRAGQHDGQHCERCHA